MSEAKAWGTSIYRYAKASRRASLLIDLCRACILSVQSMMEKQANIYEVPCTCGKVYISETRCQLETRLKEHKDACIKGFTDKSAIAELAWTKDHLIRWDDTRILQHAMELVVKEAICIRTTLESSHFNCNGGGYDILDCWIATYRNLRGGTHAGHSHPTTS